MVLNTSKKKALAKEFINWFGQAKIQAEYSKNFGLGTLIANMIPYAFITLIGSVLLFTVFFIFNIP